MKKYLILIALIIAVPIDAKQNTQSTAQIKQKIIQQSIAAYPGNCACPYQAASNGSRCGKRSAYSRKGGYAPICYAEDVTPEMIRQYKARYGGS
ncbi:hypothetical protein [Acinetobacter larvae]|uniref:Uncharacterized protein n=1 Tax=Acinetobacter larvae TaxID=1789224 RepID=A0A1B2LXM8_9GAMM|nr:hypothetical protein [Acinetobacter larvae]AOA57708.1 hypothetical protein BFG52_04615 [Acinetobacter larvae]